MEKTNEISIPIWWKRKNGMMTRRDCLPFDHPEHTYNYIKNKYNVAPEDFGVFHPLEEELKDKTREELMIEVAKTRIEIRRMLQSGLF